MNIGRRSWPWRSCISDYRLGNASQEGEDSMTNQDESNTEKRDTRMMWIATGVIVLIFVGAMGINMLLHPDTSTRPTDISTQSRMALPK